MSNETHFPFEIYYYPLLNVKVKHQHKKTHYYELFLDSSIEQLWFLPNSLINQLPESINYSVNNNGYIRNDKVISLLDNAAHNEKPVSCFFMDSEETPYLHGDGRFKILSLGEAFKQCNCHDPYSPINSLNKVFLTDVYLRSTIPLKTKKYKKVIKF